MGRAKHTLCLLWVGGVCLPLLHAGQFRSLVFLIPGTVILNLGHTINSSTRHRNIVEFSCLYSIICSVVGTLNSTVGKLKLVSASAHHFTGP